MIRIRLLSGAALLAVLAGATGCATGKQDAAQLIQGASRPGWHLKSSQDEMVVAASPMRRTLQLAGSTGFIVGAGVDLVVNSDYRDDVRQALQGYDAGEYFRGYVERRLDETLPQAAEGVAGEASGAGYANEAEARQARYRALAKQGFDTLLEVRMRYGLYGTNVELVTELDADLISLPQGKRLWSTTVYASPQPALASDRLGDPQKKKRSNESAPQFSVDKAAFARWTSDNGRLLREQFEKAVEGVTAALLDEMGLTTSAAGQLYLGKMAMDEEDFVAANDRFEKAWRIDPTLVEARNAQAVDYAQAGKVDTAIELAQAITQSTPDYAPAWYNLAWWHAIEKDDPAAARSFYDEALRLGMPRDPKIDKALAE